MDDDFLGGGGAGTPNVLLGSPVVPLPKCVVGGKPSSKLNLQMHPNGWGVVFGHVGKGFSLSGAVASCRGLHLSRYVHF